MKRGKTIIASEMVPTHGLPWPLGHSPKFMYATRPATALRRARPEIPYIYHASRFGLFVPGGVKQVHVFVVVVVARGT